MKGQEGRKSRPLKLKQEVARWNSNFDMLQRLVELKVDILAVLNNTDVTKRQHRAPLP